MIRQIACIVAFVRFLLVFGYCWILYVVSVVNINEELVTFLLHLFKFVVLSDANIKTLKNFTIFPKTQPLTELVFLDNFLVIHTILPLPESFVTKMNVVGRYFWIFNNSAFFSVTNNQIVVMMFGVVFFILLITFARVLLFYFGVSSTNWRLLYIFTCI